MDELNAHAVHTILSCLFQVEHHLRVLCAVNLAIKLIISDWMCLFWFIFIFHSHFSLPLLVLVHSIIAIAPEKLAPLAFSNPECGALRTINNEITIEINKWVHSSYLGLVCCVLCICGIVEADQFRDSIKGKWVNNRMKNIRSNTFIE